MLCPTCHGNTTVLIRDESNRLIGVRYCPDCGGCGVVHCCEGDQCQPVDEPAPDAHHDGGTQGRSTMDDADIFELKKAEREAYGRQRVSAATNCTARLVSR